MKTAVTTKKLAAFGSFALAAGPPHAFTNDDAKKAGEKHAEKGEPHPVGATA